MQIQEHEDREDSANFFLMLDVIPAIVIMLSAVVAGVSADNDPNNALWKVLEILFTLFFIAEVIVKLGGGFILKKIFSPLFGLFGKDFSQFDLRIFFRWVAQKTTNPGN